ncbi:7-cyano-7-deazaguanine synthase [Bradyrhizobium genosp. L]|uniref:7-cyano-7-deazaguanine synthase n=1 Tax=Bradyrhizobium genosp. L TaxID=83637 RepID=UPI001AEE2B82|nr:7-cyano-7-deazaguanine synthase [Bradyrhizobium genosp. L]
MKTATVLLSGGIDSASAVLLLRSNGFAVRGLFIDYGQAARDMERQAVARLRDVLGITVDELQVSTHAKHGAGELRGRNAFLVFAAVLLGNCEPGGIGIGIHAGTPYYDCSPDFVERLDELVQQCSDGKLTVLTPFVHWSKDDVYSYFLSQNISISATYSCEAGNQPPCDRCASCLDRKRLECSLGKGPSDSARIQS